MADSPATVEEKKDVVEGANAHSDVSVKPKTEPLWGKKEQELVYDPLLDNNPITIQVLGICSALAVTTLVWPSLVMSVAVVFVIAASSVITSLLRNAIPKPIRLIVQLVIIATLVSIVELTLKAVAFTAYQQLAVYIGLIITNCIVMGRLEAFSMANGPWKSFLDGLGNGLGYGAILVIVGVVREIFGKGTLFAGSPFGGLYLIGPGEDYLVNTVATEGFGTWFGWYANNNLMVLPAAAMFIIGVMIWIQRSVNPKLVDVS